jgi:predicted dehydrogenase
MHEVTRENRLLNIGMLGSGFMGRMRSHAYSVIGTIFEDLKVAPRLFAVASLDEGGLEKFAGRFGYRYCTNDWREIVHHPDIHVVTVCLPEQMHEEPVIAALRAGKHVFCEKALSLNVPSCERMVAEAERSTKLCMIGFNYRFLPAVQLARNLIRGGILGNLYHGECRYYQESGHDPDRPAEEVTYAYCEHPLGSSKGLGSHVVDIMRFLMGDMVSVQAAFKTLVPARRTSSGETVETRSDDYAAMTVEFKNGSVGMLSTSKVATGRKNQMRLEVNGSKGSIVFDVEAPNILSIYLDDAPSPELRGFTSINVTEKRHPMMESWWPPAHNLGWEHSHINEIHHWVKCIQENIPVGADGGTFQDGLASMRLIECALRSETKKRRIML